MTRFETVFDFAQSGWISLLEPYLRLLIGVIVMGVAIRRLRTPPSPSQKDPRFTFFFLLAWGGIWTVFHLPWSISATSTYITLYQEYTTHRYDVVEGSVHVQEIQPAGGHAPGDRIHVGTVSFEVDQWANSPGYHRSIAHGGILTEGAIVRIWYSNNTILRIDTRQSFVDAP
jgi:hypothetical protein